MYLDRRGAPPEVELPPLRRMTAETVEASGS
jgi:hypothetical protein